MAIRWRCRRKAGADNTVMVSAGGPATPVFWNIDKSEQGRRVRNAAAHHAGRKIAFKFAD
jgi:hypothetical protein